MSSTARPGVLLHRSTWATVRSMARSGGTRSPSGTRCDMTKAPALARASVSAHSCHGRDFTVSLRMSHLLLWACLIRFEDVTQSCTLLASDQVCGQASGVRPPVQGRARNAGRRGCDLQRDERGERNGLIHLLRRCSSSIGISAPQPSQCTSPVIGSGVNESMPHVLHRCRRTLKFGPPIMVMSAFSL